MYKAEIVADSICPRKHRITTMLVTMPRMILAEFNTHRMLSRNSASSRAIPFEKMWQTVWKNPFVPLKWMKDHKGMQGNEYLDTPELLRDRWLNGLDHAIVSAKQLHHHGLTKQICNRLLEAYMWHTVLVTATEWENFFALRVDPAAEIHMQHVAQLMLDAMNASEPKQLEEGEWHIPFGDNIDSTHFSALNDWDIKLDDWKVKISTARAAQTSYTVVGEDGKAMNYAKLIALHDRLLKSGHMSPFEHCAKTMTSDEYNEYGHQMGGFGLGEEPYLADPGWCGNFRGFIQYRKMLPNENRSDSRLKRHYELRKSDSRTS